MKNDLTCGVVRDLLPSYVENLLGEDSREAVDRHLKTCPACTAQMEGMASPSEEVKAAEVEETAKEVDFLKRVKKGTARKIALAVVCTALVLLGGIALKLFVIGTPLQPQDMAVIVNEVQDGGNTLFLSLTSIGSGDAFHGWKLETVDGVTSIYARRVTVSPFCRIGNAQMYVPLDFVREVWLGGPKSGRLLWQEGLVISQQTLDLLEAKTPYCGDAPALGNIAQLLRFEAGFGSYTMSLQTSQRPYVWTLEFQDARGSREWQAMPYYLYQMLALVENLDRAAYIYEAEDFPGRTAEDRTREYGVSAETASRRMAIWTEQYNKQHHTDWPVHESIKEYAESPLEYQRMVTLLKEHFLSQW